MSTKWWSILFGGVLGVEALATLLCPVLGWDFPRNLSTFGGGVDMLFYVILATTAFFFVLTEAILVYNMWWSTNRPAGKTPYVHGNHKLELFWTFIPGALLLLLAIAQINVWAEIKNPGSMAVDKDTQQIEVTARQWEWRIRYPSSKRMEDWRQGAGGFDRFATVGFEEKGDYDDVHQVNDVHVFQGNKVLVHLKTRDVLHSFFLPHMRLKQDALPGKTIRVWFEVTKDDNHNYNCARKTASPNEAAMPGQWEDGYDPASKSWDHHEQIWELACAEFCGTRHSMMRGKLYVHKDRDDFLAWLRAVEASDRPPQ